MGIQAEVQHAAAPEEVPPPERFQQWAEAVEHPAAASVCIRVVDEQEMAKLNACYRGKSGITNVLAFEAEPDELAQGCLGDLVICAPEVLREARCYGIEPEARFAHMTIHGLLHLLGHVHDDVRTTARMESMERATLARLGYPDPYESPA